MDKMRVLCNDVTHIWPHEQRCANMVSDAVCAVCLFKGERHENGTSWHPQVYPFGVVRCVTCTCQVSRFHMLVCHIFLSEEGGRRVNKNGPLSQLAYTVHDLIPEPGYG